MITSPRTRATRRPGIALPIALAAIVAVGALIAGVFFASTQEFRVGRNTLAAQRAMHGAEVGLSSIVSQWKWTDSVKVGGVKRLRDTIIDEALVQRQLTRVSPTVFWVTSTSVAGALGLQSRALKRLNTVIRIETPDFKIMGAVTSRGKTQLGGSAILSGTDTVPGNWDCPPGGPTASALVVNDSAANVSASGNKLTLIGDPKIKDSTALVKDTMTFTRFGGFSYDSLALLASKVRTSNASPINTVGPVLNLDGTCDIAHVDNWGATSHPHACAGYFPIVHLKGPTLTYMLQGNGGGQGIMLVDGNVEISGSFQWTGLILVRGYVKVSGTGTGGGVKITGAIAAMNRNAATNDVSGNSSVTFSRCVLDQITSKYAIAAPLQHRGWADLSF